MKRVLFILLSAAALATTTLLTTDAPLAQKKARPIHRAPHGGECGIESILCAWGLTCMSTGLTYQHRPISVCCYASYEKGDVVGFDVFGKPSVACEEIPCPPGSHRVRGGAVRV